MTTAEVVQKELAKLHRLVAVLVVIGALTWLGIAAFALHQVVELRSQQRQVETLTASLCESLGRAGIILEGSRENPCGRLPRSQSSRP